eukprot:343660-Chlamydomonas_euryale.AAC.1
MLLKGQRPCRDPHACDTFRSRSAAKTACKGAAVANAASAAENLEQTTPSRPSSTDAKKTCCLERAYRCTNT